MITTCVPPQYSTGHAKANERISKGYEVWRGRGLVVPGGNRKAAWYYP